MIDILTFEAFQKTVNDETALLAYFSTPDCSVCKVLKPHVEELLTSKFPHMESCYIDIQNVPEISGQYHVFTVPTVIVFFEGRETFRKSRSFAIKELSDAIKRPYDMIFTD